MIGSISSEALFFGIGATLGLMAGFMICACISWSQLLGG